MKKAFFPGGSCLIMDTNVHTWAACSSPCFSGRLEPAVFKLQICCSPFYTLQIFFVNTIMHVSPSPCSKFHRGEVALERRCGAERAGFLFCMPTRAVSLSIFRAIHPQKNETSNNIRRPPVRRDSKATNHLRATCFLLVYPGEPRRKTPAVFPSPRALPRPLRA